MKKRRAAINANDFLSAVAEQFEAGGAIDIETRVAHGLVIGLPRRRHAEIEIGERIGPLHLIGQFDVVAVISVPLTAPADPMDRRQVRPTYHQIDAAGANLERDVGGIECAGAAPITTTLRPTTLSNGTSLIVWA